MPHDRPPTPNQGLLKGTSTSTYSTVLCHIMLYHYYTTNQKKKEDQCQSLASMFQFLFEVCIPWWLENRGMNLDLQSTQTDGFYHETKGKSAMILSTFAVKDKHRGLHGLQVCYICLFFIQRENFIGLLASLVGPYEQA